MLPLQHDHDAVEGSAFRPPSGIGSTLGELRAALRRHRVLIAVCILGTVALVGTYTYLASPVYEATSVIRFEQEQVNLNTTILLYRNWGIFGEARRDLAKGRSLESSFGITYDDECFVASLGFHRRDTQTLNLKPSSAVLFRIGLKTGYTGL